MEFVPAMLWGPFELQAAEAQRIVMRVHDSGLDTVGYYPRDKAVQITRDVLMTASGCDWPLLCTVEPRYRVYR
jgi:ATP-dependent Clp protease adapter protein ClpS